MTTWLIHRTGLSFALAILVSITILQAVPASAHNAPKRCRGLEKRRYAQIGSIKAHGPVRCIKGRAVARRWMEKCYYPPYKCGDWSGNTTSPGDPVRIGVAPGYKCREHDVSDGEATHGRIRCKAPGGLLVHFNLYS